MQRTDRGEPASAEWRDVSAWRKNLRAALLAERAALPIPERRRREARLADRLGTAVDLRAYRALGFFWPIKAEPDLRGVASAHTDAGGVAALPVVVQKNTPVEFWRWTLGMSMRRGLWNIPVPAERLLVEPDVLLIPVVGFDRAGYRLGYGGGYYDRTLASFARKPLCIGVGYEDAEIETVYPQPHDIPMDLIVTDERVRGTAPR